MPDEPNHPIARELEAWAAERAASQPEDLAIHPATRRMLQGEAARFHGTPATQVKPSAVANPWWRAWLVGATAVFALGLILWSQSRRQAGVQLAQEMQEMHASGLPMKSAAPAESAKEFLARPDFARERRMEPANVTSTRGDAVATGQAKEVKLADVSTIAEMRLSETTGSAAAPGVLSAAAAFMAQDAAVGKQRAVSQQMMQSPAQSGFRRNLNAPQWPVLQSFEVTLADRSLELRDEDGSQYVGALPDGALLPQQAFVVTGRNLSLGEAVRFEGVIEQSNRVVTRLTGRAQVGERGELPVDARPQGP